MATPPHHRPLRDPAAPWPPAAAAEARIAEGEGGRAAAPAFRLTQVGQIFDPAGSAALAGRLADLHAELDQLCDEVDGLVQKKRPGPF